MSSPSLPATVLSSPLAFRNVTVILTADQPHSTRRADGPLARLRPVDAAVPRDR